MRGPKAVTAALAYAALAPRADPVPPPEAAGRPVVAGFLRSASGMGEVARQILAGLSRTGYRPACRDLTPRFQPAAMMPPVACDPPELGEAGPLVLVANPPELSAVACHLGRAMMHGRLVVGHWSWELERIPPGWRRAFRYVHEIWVPSQFTADAVAPVTDRPVRVVAPPLRPVAATADRAGFGIPADAIVVLVIADSRSSLARKNVAGAVAAFRHAFGTRTDRRLVVKLNAPDAVAPRVAELASAVQALPNATLIAATLPQERQAALIAGADIVLSLHRSEGFGLVLAEAMLAGKAVVATDWSGSRDFATAETAALVPAALVPVSDPYGIYRAPGQRWAEPDAAAAVEQLRRLADDGAARAALGARAARHMRAFCDDRRFAESLGAPFAAACHRAPANDGCKG